MKSKVLFVLHIPPPMNGAAKVGQYIKESHLINDTFITHFVNLTTSFNLKNIEKKGIKKYFTVLNIQLELVNALLNNKYDLCYMTMTAKGVGFYKDLFVLIILKFFGIKTIFHFHNKGVINNSKYRLNNLLYKAAFSNTKSILLSPYLYYDISKYVKKEDVYYCANGIPSSKNITESGKNKIQNSQQPISILFLSNMMIEKGVFILLYACKILKNRGIDFSCHFVGAWSDVTEEMFNQVVEEYNLSNQVTAYGQKYNDEKLYYLNNADIFVFPTYYHNECFPLVLLEAMDHSLPIISTFEGGIPEIVVEGTTGFLVTQKNAESLSLKLEQLILDHTLRINMGIAAKKRYEELYTIKMFEQNLKYILENAIK